MSGQQLVLLSVFVLEKGKGDCTRKDYICPALLQKKYSKAFKAAVPNTVTVLADNFFCTGLSFLISSTTSLEALSATQASI